MSSPDANPPDLDPLPPRMIELHQTRALTADERRILEYLIRGSGGCDELRAQLSSTRVVDHCDCDCPSLGLESDGPPVPEVLVARREPLGRNDYFAIRAARQNAAGQTVDVIMHVGLGGVSELEIWAGSWGRRPGHGPRIDRDGATRRVTGTPERAASVDKDHNGGRARCCQVVSRRGRAAMRRDASLLEPQLRWHGVCDVRLERRSLVQRGFALRVRLRLAMRHAPRARVRWLRRSRR